MTYRSRFFVIFYDSFVFVSFCHLTSLSPFSQFHVDKKGRVNYAQTDMLIHVVNNQTNTILDVERWTFRISSYTMVGLSLPGREVIWCPGVSYGAGLFR